MLINAYTKGFLVTRLATAEDAVFDRTERDFDNGIHHYEIEFRVGFTEYEYDIHAENGTVLSFEKDN